MEHAARRVKPMGILRFDAPRKNQRPFIRFAADYEIGRITIPTVEVAQAVEREEGQLTILDGASRPRRQ
jgi:hypothetical protein